MEDLGSNAPLFFLIINGITSLVAIAVSVVSWIKSAKLMPKELTKADLENKQTELSIVEQYDLLATTAVLKRVETQERLDALEKKYKTQAELIRTQAIRLDEQEREISGLIKELRLAQAYNQALILQMCEANIVPRDISDIDVDAYEENIKNGDGIRKK